MPGGSSTSPRVRFAPSPTGYLHVGGARTAIFNWLFARGAGGVFVLRIEDTDVERSTKESEASLIEDLRWLGLDWDEGPDKDGGVGPYRQSERLDLYRKTAGDLVAAGVAYPCFCTDEILTAKREKAFADGKPPQYDGTCRSLTPAEVEASRAQGLPEAVRFKVPGGAVRFEDRVRGAVELATNMVGDFILFRSNGRPTYNFAAAVDDRAMGITHVLRGEEHLPNTLRQILIYQALDSPVPEFAHLPLILAEDRSKLSKRHGASSVGELQKMGFLAGAVVNYLVLLGWSHPDAKEVLTTDEIVGVFTLDRINKSAAVYDKQKLRWMNGQHLRGLPLEAFAEMGAGHLPDFVTSLYSEAQQKEILRLLQESVETLNELKQAAAPFRSPPDIEEEALEALKADDASAVLAGVADSARQLPDGFAAPDFKGMMKTVGKSTGVKGKPLFFPVRAAITGSVHGPDLAGIAAVKGRAALIDLIERAQSIAESD
jgi:glutamyl-tRNA synthetase